MGSSSTRFRSVRQSLIQFLGLPQDMFSGSLRILIRLSHQVETPKVFPDVCHVHSGLTLDSQQTIRHSANPSNIFPD